MIAQFVRLEMSENLDSLTCEVRIDEDAYPDVYIDKIYIEWYENLNTNLEPSDKAFVAFDHDLQEPTMVYDPDTLLPVESDELIQYKYKAVTVNCDETFKGITKAPGLKGEMFYVIVECAQDTTGNDDDDYTADDLKSVGVISDLKTVYSRGIQYIAQLFKNDCNCSVVDGFCDFVMGIEAFKFAKETDSWELMNRFWERISRSSTMTRSGCSCGK